MSSQLILITAPELFASPEAARTHYCQLLQEHAHLPHECLLRGFSADQALEFCERCDDRSRLVLHAGSFANCRAAVEAAQNTGILRLHLREADDWLADVPEWLLVSQSAHAASWPLPHEDQLVWQMLSPVFATPKPYDVSALGADWLKQHSDKLGQTIVLGGIDSHNLKRVLAACPLGVAVRRPGVHRAVWGELCRTFADLHAG